MIRSLFYMSPAPLPGIKLFNLTGRCAVVTGGSKGLGLAMAAGLASAGADLVLVSRHAEEAAAAYDRGAMRMGHPHRNLPPNHPAALSAAIRPGPWPLVITASRSPGTVRPMAMMRAAANNCV